MCSCARLAWFDACGVVLVWLFSPAQDLGAADPYMAFPIMTGVMMMAMAELGGEGGAMAGSSKKMKAGMRGMALLVTPFTMHISTGVFVYWTTSNVYSILQTLLFKVGGGSGRNTGAVLNYCMV